MIKKLVCLLDICSALVIIATPSALTYADKSEIITIQSSGNHGIGSE